MEHVGLDLDCPGQLDVPLSTSDWYDCPTAGDIIHCQGFVEIGSNLYPNNKLEVSHGQEEYARQGISLNNTRTDEIKTNEIYFRKNNDEQWAIGNDLGMEGGDIGHNFFVWDHYNRLTRIFINTTGTGINNTTPTTEFDVDGHIRSSALGNGSGQVVQTDTNGILINTSISSLLPNFNYWKRSGSDVYRDSGKVFIGMLPCTSSCSSTLYKLYVEGGILARDIKVTATTNPFPDFVFDKKYKLRSLPDLEKYITENKHLPNIPSAEEIQKNEGFEVGAMQSKLLQTIEEQALYIIDLQKQMNEVKAELAAIKK